MSNRSRKVISSFNLCPLARECRNNVCMLRANKIRNYPLTPSTKQEQDLAKSIEKEIGRVYLPRFETILRNDHIQVICPDFME